MFRIYLELAIPAQIFMLNVNKSFTDLQTYKIS
jgi:hypothetical protein